MARIFLTGATGFVGSFVAQRLVEQRHEVVCLVRPTSNLRWIRDLPLTLVQGSLFQPETYREYLRQSEYILHVAGVTKGLKIQDFYRGNVETTRYLLETVVTLGVPLRRFLLVSSQAAVGPSPSRELIKEDFPCRPITDYGRSKLAAERLLFSFRNNVPFTIVRPPAVYGPRDTDILNFFKNLKAGFNLTVGKVDQWLSLVYVEDLARGILQAAFSPEAVGKTYFLCEDQAYFWSQVSRLATDIMGKSVRTVHVPYGVAYLVASILELVSKIRRKPTILNRQKMKEIRQPYWGISNQRARKDLGYRTHVPLEAGIKRTIEWYQQMGWL